MSIVYTTDNGVVTATVTGSGQYSSSITTQVFTDNSSVTKIILIDYTSIGDYAFSGRLGLTSITIPNSVTSIGEGAFQNCTGLTSFTIPNSVTSINYATFDSCTSLTSITIPAGFLLCKVKIH